MAKSFLWGAATSAHQVEGDNIHNDWWAWEKRASGVTQSGKAANHYERFEEDFSLARELGHTAHRLSLEWSRIEPVEGAWSKRALLHYREVLLRLREQGLKSFVTLHHFTNPRWLADQGSWENTRTPQKFARYTRVVAEELGDLVDFWITINEPMVYATQGWWYKRWPPGALGPGQETKLFDRLADARKLQRVIRHLAYGHRRAYDVLHERLDNPQVGLAKHVISYEPADEGSWFDQAAVGVADWWFNQRWFRLTRGSYDFIGVNHYLMTTLAGQLWPPRVKLAPWDGLKSDLGWAIRPEGLKLALLNMARYGLPLYVTENGLADADDSRRPDFIRDSLRALEAAQEQGVDVRGYLHWSLLDNFEWAKGFEPRFGLVAVDYTTMKRTPRPSAYVYKAIIEQAQ